MSNHYSCWSYAYDQAGFIETKLIFSNKFALIWLSLGKIRVILEKEMHFSRNCNK